MQSSKILFLASTQNNNFSFGVLLVTAILIGLPLFGVIIWLKADYSRHKRPLKEIDPNVKYTFWHHIKVVTIPLLSYRITFVIQKKR